MRRMKLVLSRKGFDSQYGRVASPILPDGRLLPLPIPSSHDRDTMRSLGFDQVDLDQILRDLSGGRISGSTRVHLDPQLVPPSTKLRPGWRPSLGQTGSAQSHLANQGVGVGDVFLFFGWFHEVELRQGRWRYCRPKRDLHVMFGWLEVGETLSIVTDRQGCLARHPWIATHPHVANPSHYTDVRNTLYIAPRRSRLATNKDPGAGRFVSYAKDLVLTGPGSLRSTWRLPAWFMPSADRPALSYHDHTDRWRCVDDRVELKSVAKGQEFVLQLNYYPEARRWLRSLVNRHGKRA